jgi:hypothetical protein
MGIFFDNEAKRTCSIVNKFISKRSEHVYIKNLNIEVKRIKLVLNCGSSEVRRTCWFLIKCIAKENELVNFMNFK